MRVLIGAIETNGVRRFAHDFGQTRLPMSARIFWRHGVRCNRPVPVMTAVYIALDRFTLAHLLGYRLRDFAEQNKFVKNGET